MIQGNITLCIKFVYNNHLMTTLSWLFKTLLINKWAINRKFGIIFNTG